MKGASPRRGSRIFEILAKCTKSVEATASERDDAERAARSCHDCSGKYVSDLLLQYPENGAIRAKGKMRAGINYELPGRP